MARPRCFEEAHPITAHDALDIAFVIASLTHQIGHSLQVGNCVQIARTLFRAVTSIQVTSYGGVSSIAGQLADAVNVIDNGL